jgi:hypothetical protein
MTLDEKSGMKELDGWIEQVRGQLLLVVGYLPYLGSR